MRVEQSSDGVVEISGSAEELDGLAAVVARGAGRFVTEEITAIEVRSDESPGLLAEVDTQRRVLLLSGDRESRTRFADSLAAVVAMNTGQPQRIEYGKDSDYLRKDSAPLLLNSPRAATPPE
ncbi:hypothetical protein [Nocardia sp. NPDC005978]|uniref:Imm32 family immunity protein n=1 Tax=unclassified Nocardia TaxID=2637762 RepID=UPI0033A18741